MIHTTTWTVEDLLGALSEHDPEAEVRLAFQPSWPLQFALHGPVATHDLDDLPDLDEERSVVRIVAGEHPQAGPYAPAGLWG